MTYILFNAALLLQGLLTYGRRNARHLFYIVSLIGFFVFDAFRYRVGCDWLTYEKIFESQRYQSYFDALESREPAFAIVNVLIHALSLDYPYINVLTALLFFAGLHALAVRQPDRLGFLILSFPVLVINLPMSAIRQAAALGLLCFAFIAFNDKRIVRYVIFVILGSAFHASALIFLALVPFVVGDFSKKTIAFSIALFLPGLYLGIAETFEIYERRYVGTSIEAAGAPFRTALVAAAGLLFAILLRSAWRVRFAQDYKLALIGSLLMIATFPIALLSSVIGDRFGYYLMPLQLMVLARISYIYQGRDAALIGLAPYVVFAVFLAVWTQYSVLFSLCYLPYRSWLL